MHHAFDRVLCGAQCALFFALDGRRDSSIRLIERVSSLIDALRPDGLFCTRSVALALLFCVVAEMVNQRLTAARKLSRRIRSEPRDEVVFLALRFAEHFTQENGVLRDREVAAGFERLRFLGYADVVRVLEAATAAFESSFTDRAAPLLTPSEVSILHLLGEGLTTKEMRPETVEVFIPFGLT